jgi:hypothetical protein
MPGELATGFSKETGPFSKAQHERQFERLKRIVAGFVIATRSGAGDRKASVPTREKPCRSIARNELYRYATQRQKADYCSAASTVADRQLSLPDLSKAVTV